MINMPGAFNATNRPAQRRPVQRRFGIETLRNNNQPGRIEMNRRTMLRFGAATALGALAHEFGAPAFAQQKLVLKATDVHPLGYPTVEAVLGMGKKLEAVSGGRIGIQMYPSMQLGGEKEM